jgi:hypothetical protein
MELFPVILGDLIYKDKSTDIEAHCKEGRLSINSIIKGLKIKYIIDCTKGKLISATADNSSKNEEIRISYEDFINSNHLLYPQKISIEYLKIANSIKIRIIKMESPWNGNIKFIPGNRYEILPLI